MDAREQQQRLIAKIHASPGRVVLAVSGGGSDAIGQLLAVPGASRTVLEARVPYAAEALAEFLGGAPEQYCAERTARAMAMAAFIRAEHLSRGDVDQCDPRCLGGVGCTASLASDRPKCGPHRVYVALQTAGLTESFSLELGKGRRTRSEEEAICTQLVLNSVAEACGVGERVELALESGEEVVVRREEAAAEWTALLLGEVSAVPICATAGDVQVVFSGAFDPRHAGHRRMAEVARQMTGGRVDHEISIDNVDKPPIDFVEIAERLTAFDVDEPVWLTSTATFVEKGKVFPGATFIVGTEALVRIADPRYYRGDPERAAGAVASIADAGCRFLVFGRTIEGRFFSLADVEVPDRLREICDAVPEASFRDDVSSSEIRGQNGAE